MKRTVASVLITMALIAGGFDVMAVEEAKYDVVLKEEACELRDYAPHVLAEVVVGGSVEDAGNAAFRILFRYISGGNQSSTNISMTAPVSQERRVRKIDMTEPVGQQRTADGWAVSFMMPATFAMETTPAPNDSRINLRAVPARRVAAIRYSGAWSESRYLEHKVELESWIRKKGLVIDGEIVWARYNSPFALWFVRRNEVLIPVRK